MVLQTSVLVLITTQLSNASVKFVSKPKNSIKLISISIIIFCRRTTLLQIGHSKCFKFTATRQSGFLLGQAIHQNGIHQVRGNGERSCYDLGIWIVLMVTGGSMGHWCIFKANSREVDTRSITVQQPTISKQLKRKMFKSSGQQSPKIY